MLKRNARFCVSAWPGADTSDKISGVRRIKPLLKRKVRCKSKRLSTRLVLYNGAPRRVKQILGDLPHPSGAKKHAAPGIGCGA